MEYSTEKPVFLLPSPHKIRGSVMTDQHGERVLSQWQSLRGNLKLQYHLQLNGDSLDIPKFIAVARFVKILSRMSSITDHPARYGIKASVDGLSEENVKKIDKSVQFLSEELAHGHSVYGELHRSDCLFIVS